MSAAYLRALAVVVIGVVLSLPGAPAYAASHLWRFNEVFTNADGTVQFIELKECCGADSEIFLAAKWVKSTTTGKVYTFPTDLTGVTSNKYLLLGTAGFAALPGAPSPDYIMPNNFLGMNGDRLEYWFYPDAFMTYGGGALPTNGITSLRIDGTTGVNSPTNFAGASGSVNATTCIDNDVDGYGSPGNAACPNGSATDCNDNNPAIHPGAVELCADGADNNCNGLQDCADPACAGVSPCPCIDVDGDGYGSPGNSLCLNGSAADCDDANPAINPAATELCTDHVDNNCNGLTDCADPPCASVVPCIPTLSQWGLLSMTLLLLSIGSVMVTRRRAAYG